MYSISQLKPGTAFMLDGEPVIVTRSQFSKQARQGGVMKTVLKNLKTGSTIQKTFSGNTKLEPADLSRARAQYLYDDGSSYVFMHKETYDQYEIAHDFLADQIGYLVEGGDADLLLFEGNPIGLDVPPKVVLKVVETIPGVKGDTAQGGSKPAKLETGITVNVPLFINEGDMVRVNTDEGTYVERVKE